MMKVPVCEPNLDIRDERAAAECVHNTWISGISPAVSEFEKRFARYVGVDYGVATNSGTTALHLALAALGLKRGDEIIIPTFTMIACANAARYLGLKIRLVDCEPDTWCMNPSEVVYGPKTKAVMPVHIYGHPCQAGLEKFDDVFVVEDCAEAIGAEINGRKVGWFGNAGCFSFYANKNITTGEGGMIVSDDAKFADRAGWLRAHAFGRETHFYHLELGYGYRMSGLQAALGTSQLARVDELVQKKRDNAQLYLELLQPLADKGLITLPVEREGCKNVYWMFSVLLEEADRDKLMVQLAQDGVETRPFFTPIHKQPIYRHLHGDFPVAELISRKGINLPSATTLTQEQIEYVCEKVKEHVQ